MDWQAHIRLGDQVAVGVHDRGRVIVALFDIRGIARLHQRDEAFVIDGFERIGEDFEADSVKFSRIRVGMGQPPSER